MIPHKNIVCLLNIISPWRSKADGFFDFIREPIRQACGIDIGYAPGRMPSKLLPGFDLAHFRSLAQKGSGAQSGDLWLATFHHMPTPALDYLFNHIPAHALILSSEMPPWLSKACEKRQQEFLDIRQSPLGFTRDSLIAINTNNITLRSRLAECAVSEDELRLEAGLLSANMRIHRAQLEESLRHVFNLDNTLICAWQAPWDTSLLQPDGVALHFSHFSEQLKSLAKGRKVLLMRDFSDTHIADTLEKERSLLSVQLEMSVSFCPQNIYQILTGHDDSELVSINSSVHQEAPYFNKTSHAFVHAVTPLAQSEIQLGYLQVHFQDILQPVFWHKILSPQTPLPHLLHLPQLDRQLGRESMNDWGEYERVLTWERYLPWQTYRRLGGIDANRRIENLENRVTTAQNDSPIISDGMSGRIKALKNTKIGQTAYILGNGPSLNELNIKKLMTLESFWCNKAYKMENEGVPFLPKYYFLNDAIVIQQDPERVLNIQAEIKFLGSEAIQLFKIMKPESLGNAIEFNVTWKPGMHEGEGNFSLDPSSSIFDGSTILAAAVQFAFYMGYSKVFVGGVDLDYSQPYFYGSAHKHKNTSAHLNSEKMRKSFEVMRDIFKKNQRVLAKITQSPNLPLDYVEIQDLQLTHQSRAI